MTEQNLKSNTKTCGKDKKMGMAAGQARLLSITSRISDNELRAQLINNDKIRLSTESSQVSEAYVQALNEAQMMFTSYDANNNASYQPLTFNALTAYNQYNNQYILTNASGNVLLSEKDATNYKNANGDVEKFLQAYGIEKSTTYWENLDEYAYKVVDTDDTDKTYNYLGIEYKTGAVNNEGDEILGYMGDPYNSHLDENNNPDYKGLTDYVQALYEGNIVGDVGYIGADGQSVDKLHPGYMDAVSSADYGNYYRFLEKYTTKYDEYLGTVVQKMSEKFNGFKVPDTVSTLDGSAGTEFKGKTFQEIKTAFNGLNASDSNYTANLKSCMTALEKIAEQCKAVATTTGEPISGTEYYDNIINTLQHNSGANQTDTINMTCKYDEGGFVFSEGDDKSFKLVYNSTSDNYDVYIWSETYDDDGKVISQGWGNKITSTESGSSNYTFTYTDIYTDDAGNDQKDPFYYTIPQSMLPSTTATTTTDWTSEGDITIETPNTAANMAYVIKSVIDVLPNSIYTYFDPEDEEYYTMYKTKSDGTFELDSEGKKIKMYETNSDGSFKLDSRGEKIPITTPEYNAYTTAATELSEQVFGSDIGKVGYPNLGDIEWIKDVFDNAEWDDSSNQYKYTLTDADGVEHTIKFNKETFETKRNDFQKIYDAYLLDCIMDTYGEPYYTWIDKNNPNENGEAKAEWYENLFNRIQSGGYKVLQDGLASSNEWIQFAFESGIVNMEQVDENRNWQGLIYSNCSDITEQTNDAAVAKAEAEYNAAMNKIETKDKQYDLELKNIDTEHNSLETEYDSIKNAISKNIERTFKLYS